MKLAIVLLCVVAAVQGRNTAVKVVNNDQRAVPALGEHPWVAHLRLAVESSGHLETCAGALIHVSWVLTSAECVQEMRFCWVRLGAVQMIRPERVYETSAVIPNSDWNSWTNSDNVALINLNRVVDLSENIAVIALPHPSSDVPERATYCAYGEDRHNVAGEWLNCWDVSLVSGNREKVSYEVRDDISVTEFDSGAPLTKDGVLYGVLSHLDRGFFRDDAVFIRANDQVNWIVGMTGMAVPEPSQVIVVDN